MFSQKHFYFSGVSFAMTIEAGGEHAGVIEHQTVAGMEVGRKVTEGVILPGARLAVDHQHARGGAVGERLLCDQFFGEMVVEIGKQHCFPL